MIWLLMGYLSIGAIWALYMTISFLDDLDTVAEVLMCWGVNMIFWPLIMILAIASNQWRKGMGGH